MMTGYSYTKAFAAEAAARAFARELHRLQSERYDPLEEARIQKLAAQWREEDRIKREQRLAAFRWWNPLTWNWA